MATHTSLTSLFTDIADAIRTKTGGSGELIADRFPQAIDNIVTDPSGDCDATNADILEGKTAYAANTLRIGTIPTKTSSDLTASGATVTVPSGYYASQATKSVDTGSYGAITASKSAVSNNTITVTPRIAAGTAGYNDMSASSGTAVTVSASEVVSENKALASSTSAQTDIDVTNYATVSVSAIATGALGTVSASKSISGNTATITPSISGGTAGYISATSKSGSAVTVTASEVCNSGTLTKTVNGSYSCTGYSTVTINVPSSSTSIYKIYDSSNNEISSSNWTISGLANAYYYTKNGGSMQRVGGRIFYINSCIAEGSGDKFYVYDNTNGLQTNKYWGYYGTSCSCTTNTIGSGKTNTATIFSKGIPTDYTPNIWEWAQSCRTNSVGGCTDWYIGSIVENDQLRISGLVNWFDSNYIWSAVEYLASPSVYSLFWNYNCGYWYDSIKKANFCCFCVRSF